MADDAKDMVSFVVSVLDPGDDVSASGDLPFVNSRVMAEREELLPDPERPILVAAPMLATFKRCDLFGMDEAEARRRLEAYLAPAVEPPGPVPFPGEASQGQSRTRRYQPGSASGSRTDSPSGSQADSPSAVAKLAELGWTVKPAQDGTQFEVMNQAIPPMRESAVYFAQLSKPFSLHLQGVPSLEGLHFLAGVSGCTKIEINAGEFTDISELRGFDHLTALTISQVPLSGIGTVDASAIGSLSNLRQLFLNYTKVRNAGFLGALTRLKTLSVGQTLVNDLSPVSGLADLETLDIRGSRVTDLQPLSGSSNLSELTIGAQQIPGLINLVRLRSLKKLSIIIEQQNFNLDPVGALTTLESLWISVTSFGQIDVAPLRSLTNLRGLSLSAISIGYPPSPITDIEAIGDLAELRTLTIGSLQLTNLAFLTKLTNLEELSIYRSPISSIEQVRDLKLLKKVGLHLTAVEDISPLLDLPSLTDLTIGRTPARSDLLAELERRGVKVNRY
jgi:internalin A